MDKKFTKICRICGLEKPFSAFLLIADPQGRSSGNVCADCRKTMMEKNRPKEPDESTRSGTGVVIDSKVKVHADIEKKQTFHRTEEQYHEEQDEKQEKHADKQHQRLNTDKETRKHRETFLSKRTFLDAQKTAPAGDVKVAGGESQAAKERQFNYQAPVLDTQIAGKLKFQTAMFNQWKTLLGAGAPIVSAAEKAAANQKAEAAKGKKKDESPADYTRDTLSRPGRNRT